MILIVAFHLLSENTHCGARWKDHKTSDRKPCSPLFLILVKLYGCTSSWKFVKLPNQQSKEVSFTCCLILSFLFLPAFLFGGGWGVGAVPCSLNLV